MKSLLLSLGILLGAVIPPCFPRYTRVSRHLELIANTNVTITSPGYGRSLYPNHVYYSWDIVSPEATRINVDFNKIDVEYHVLCRRDRIILYNNRCSDLRRWQVRSLCGRKYHYRFSFVTNVACIVFVTDFRKSRPGFIAEVSAIPERPPKPIYKTKVPPLTTKTTTTTTKTEPMTTTIQKTTLGPIPPPGTTSAPKTTTATAKTTISSKTGAMTTTVSTIVAVPTTIRTNNQINSTNTFSNSPPFREDISTSVTHKSLTDRSPATRSEYLSIPTQVPETETQSARNFSTKFPNTLATEISTERRVTLNATPSINLTAPISSTTGTLLTTRQHQRNTTPSPSSSTLLASILYSKTSKVLATTSPHEHTNISTTYIPSKLTTLFIKSRNSTSHTDDKGNKILYANEQSTTTSRTLSSTTSEEQGITTTLFRTQSRINTRQSTVNHSSLETVQQTPSTEKSPTSKNIHFPQQSKPHTTQTIQHSYSTTQLSFVANDQQSDSTANDHTTQRVRTSQTTTLYPKSPSIKHSLPTTGTQSSSTVHQSLPTTDSYNSSNVHQSMPTTDSHSSSNVHQSMPTTESHSSSNVHQSIPTTESHSSSNVHQSMPTTESYNSSNVHQSMPTTDSHSSSNVHQSIPTTESHSSSNVHQSMPTTDSHSSSNVHQSMPTTDSHSSSNVHQSIPTTESHSSSNVHQSIPTTESHSSSNVHQSIPTTESHSSSNVHQAMPTTESHSLSNVHQSIPTTESHNSSNVQQSLPTTESTILSTQSHYSSGTTENVQQSSPCQNNGGFLQLDGESGYIDSPGFPERSPYPPNTSCRWKIHNSDDKMVIVTFEAFDVEWSEACQWDRLAFYSLTSDTDRSAPLSVYCGDHLPDTLTLQHDVMVEFVSDSLKQKRGFRFKYIKVNPGGQRMKEVTSCAAGYVPCWRSGSGSCVPVEWICDGDADCTHGEDEEACTTCDAGEVSCGDGTCLEGHVRCDGHSNCPHGEDELDCVRQADDGKVSVTLAGDVLPLCFTEDTRSYKHQLCRLLGYREASSIYYSRTTKDTRYAIINTNGEGGSFKKLGFIHSQSCPGDRVTYLQCKDTECGLRPNPGRQKRIVGGSITEGREVPWIVAIRTGDKVVCGGTIVAGMWVVTAGHCVQNFLSKPLSVTVIAGANDLQAEDKQEYYVSEVILHPNYKNIYNSDIALLRLTTPVPFTPEVSPGCLPWDEREFTPSSRCVVAGWGVHNISDYYSELKPRYLRHLKTKLMDVEQCRAIYTDTKPVRDDHMMCAGYTGGGMDACKGDSGGPLMCEVADGRWVLAGVISWGELCGGVGKPGVYTSVAAFMDWIDNTMGGNDKMSPNCTFESADWCGYNGKATEMYFWTRRQKRGAQKDHYLYAERPGQGETGLAEAILMSPAFRLQTTSCLSFSHMFSRTSNVTLTLYGHVNGQSDASKLWTNTGDAPSNEQWHRTGIEIQQDVTRLRFVATYDHDGSSGVGLDDVSLSPTPCQALNFMACAFDENDLCQYYTPNTSNFKAWKLQRKNTSSVDYAAFAGGPRSKFGFMTIAQLLSPVVDSDFVSQTRCLHFSYNQLLVSNHPLEVCTYLDYAGYLTNRELLWSSTKSVTNTWVNVKVTINSGHYDRVAFEVTRSRYDSVEIGILLDDIKMTDGYCF